MVSANVCARASIRGEGESKPSKVVDRGARSSNKAKPEPDPMSEKPNERPSNDRRAGGSGVDSSDDEVDSDSRARLALRGGV